MKLEKALLCVEMDCQEVFESTGSGYCPSCGSGVALPVAQVLNREPHQAVAFAPRAHEQPHLRLVVPDRTLESPAALLSEALEPAGSSPLVSEALTQREGAELTDFRRYLEERMAGLEQPGGHQDPRIPDRLAGGGAHSPENPAAACTGQALRASAKQRLCSSCSRTASAS